MNKIEINGDISQWNMSASYLKYKLNGLSGDLEVRINSYGGDVFEGIAMYNILRDYAENKGSVTTVNTSICASIASLIFLAGDKRKCYENSTIMLHRAWSWSAGNSDELQTTLNLLKGIDAVLTNTYSKFMSESKEEIDDILSKEGWYIGKDQLEATGFVNEFIDDRNEKINISDAKMMYNSVIEKISAKAEAQHIKPNASFIKDEIVKCNDGKCPIENKVASMPSASDGVKIEKITLGANMKFDRNDLDTTEQTFNALVANRDTMASRNDVIKMQLETAESALEAKESEISSIKADFESKLSEAETAKESGIVEARASFMAEAETRIQEAMTENASAETIMAMLKAETAEEASTILNEARESEGSFNKGDSENESGLLAFAKANKGSIR